MRNGSFPLRGKDRMRGSNKSIVYFDPLTPTRYPKGRESLREREFLGKQLLESGSYINRINEGNSD